MSTITTINASDTVANSRTDINTNFSNLNTDKIETSVLDTDTSLAANSDSNIATQRATKAYVDTKVGVNASESVKGVVEMASDAEAAAGTDTGGTGASLAVKPSQLQTEVAGMSRTRKITIDPSFTEIADTTTTETNIFSTTITGGSLSTNNAVRFKILFTNLSVSVTSTADPVFRLKYGSTTLATMTLTEGDGLSLSGYVEGLLMANASTSAQSGSFQISAHEETVTLSGGDTSVRYVSKTVTGTATEDSTGDLTLALTIQWGTTQSANDFVPAGIVVELIS